MKRLIVIALAAVAMASGAFVTERADAYHLTNPNVSYWDRPTPAGNYTPGGEWRNLVFFKETPSSTMVASGWTSGGVNARAYQTGVNELLYGGTGSNVVPGAVFRDYHIVLYNGDSPAQGYTQGDIVVHNGTYGGAGSGYCGVPTAALGCAFTWLDSGNDSFGVAMSTLNDTVAAQFGYTSVGKHAAALHEIGHTVGLAHVEQDTVVAARTQESVMRATIGNPPAGNAGAFTYPWHIGGTESDWGSVYALYAAFHPNQDPASPTRSSASSPASRAGDEPRPTTKQIRELRGKPFATFGFSPSDKVKDDARRGLSSRTYQKWARGDMVLTNLEPIYPLDPIVSTLAGR